CFVHQAPEGDAAQRLLPDVLALRGEPTRFLEELSRMREVLRALRLERLLLRDEREPEPSLGIVARHLEEHLRIAQVAVLERRVSGLLRLSDAAVSQQREAALRVRIV